MLEYLYLFVPVPGFHPALAVLTTLAINTDPLRARAAALHTAAYLTHALTECLAAWVTSMRHDADLRDSMRSDC